MIAVADSQPDTAQPPRLSERQRRLLEAIKAYWETFGIPPSIREIATAAKFKSTSDVRLQLEVLVSFGLVTRRERIARSICLTEQGQTVIYQLREQAHERAEAAERNRMDPYSQP